MRIIAGTMKGKIIPFDNKKYGGADITMQMVKESVFGILTPRIQGSRFLDLFACSGQIALEALSRGATSAVLNERDRHRGEYLRTLLKGFAMGERAVLLHLSWEKALRRCAEESRSFDIVFCDPPYEKKAAAVPIYTDILREIEATGVLSEQGIVVLQHHYGNILEENVGRLTRTDQRKYGQTGITIYAYADLT